MMSAISGRPHFPVDPQAGSLARMVIAELISVRVGNVRYAAELDLAVRFEDGRDLAGERHKITGPLLEQFDVEPRPFTCEIDVREGAAFLQRTDAGQNPVAFQREILLFRR